MSEVNETKKQQKTIKYLFKKNKIFYLWVLFLLSLPLVVEFAIYFIEQGLRIDLFRAFKKIFYTQREYQSYYATIFTLSFAIFSYNKQQEKLLEEKQKENELKEKEIEQKRDYYRPSFIVRKKSNSKNQIKLLMKNEELYLENIKVFKTVIMEDMFEYVNPLSGVMNLNYGSSMNYLICEKQSLKSGDIITEDESDILFVVAETLIGETVLFGYFYKYKFYKYLKENKDPSIPNDSRELYNQELIKSVWGSFNTKTELKDNTLDLLFFGYSKSIRQVIEDKYLKKFENSLKAETLSVFLKNIFFDIQTVGFEFEVCQKSIYRILKNYMLLLYSVSSCLFIDSENKEEFNSLVQYIPENIMLENNILNKLSDDILGFLKIVNNFIDYREESAPEDFLQFLDVLQLLNNAFEIIKINDKYVDENIIQSNFMWEKLILDIKIQKNL